MCPYVCPVEINQPQKTKNAMELKNIFINNTQNVIFATFIFVLGCIRIYLLLSIIVNNKRNNNK